MERAEAEVERLTTRLARLTDGLIGSETDLKSAVENDALASGYLGLGRQLERDDQTLGEMVMGIAQFLERLGVQLATKNLGVPEPLHDGTETCSFRVLGFDACPVCSPPKSEGQAEAERQAIHRMLSPEDPRVVAIVTLQSVCVQAAAGDESEIARLALLLVGALSSLGVTQAEWAAAGELHRATSQAIDHAG
jgi:hypothetical protein